MSLGLDASPWCLAGDVPLADDAQVPAQKRDLFAFIYCLTHIASRRLASKRAVLHFHRPCMLSDMVPDMLRGKRT